MILILLVMANKGYGQEINGVQIKDIDSEYISITGWNELSGAWLRIDYGQEITTLKETPLTDVGRKYKFKSVVHCIDVFNANGYEVVHYSISAIGSKIRKGYLLKKVKL